METNNKPDFEKMAANMFGLALNGPAKSRVEGFIDGCEKIWNDYVIVRDAKIKTMIEVLAYADEELSRLKTGKESQLYDMIKERDAKISELQTILSGKTFFDEKDVLEKENLAIKSELDDLATSNFQNEFSKWFQNRYSISLNPIGRWTQITAGDIFDFWDDYFLKDKR